MIQSQFDAASKLGASKAEPSVVASDERPRKRRKTSPPVEDSIEVAPESLESPASPIDCDITKAADLGDDISTATERSIKAAVSRDKGDPSTKFESDVENSNGELVAQVEDEVMLLSEESALRGEHLLFNQDKDRNQDSGAKEEVPDPPNAPQDSSNGHMHLDQPHQTTQVVSSAASTDQATRHHNSPSQSLSSIRKPPEDDKPSQLLQAEQSNTQSSGLSTPKPASNSGPQTNFSSPLSSPPPAELFDPFDEQSTGPPPSSTRPSSPVSTDNEGDEKDGDGDESEPSCSQDYLNRSSTFKRSLSTLKGKELFDASIWSDPLKTSVFYTFATNLRQKSRDAAPTGCHQFIGHLSKAGKMVRCYTQNIDLLEDKVGLSTRLLLGTGSRSRFSTRTSRGVAASLGSVGPRSTGASNNQSLSVPSVSCPGAPTSSQPAVCGQAAFPGASPTNIQGTSTQLFKEADIGHPRTSSGNREPAEGSSDKNGEREQDDATADTQPAAASSTDPDKSLPGADRGTSPEHDRGVECVFLHGSLRALRCFQCGCVTDWDDGRELQTMSGQQPPCPRCEDATNARQERGKRALGVGKLRPDIVLYGEDHPDSQQISSIIQHDISLAPDMLIIMGTSLKVHGLKTVVREFAKTVHNRKDGKVIFVNYTKPAESVWADTIDFWVEMDCDSWVEDLKEKKPIIWLPPGTAETEPRTTIPKRRRPLNDGAEKKEGKKVKKVEKNTKTATAASAKDQGKVNQLAKLETPTSTDSKPYVPKRPAAHRDCKQNAAYWTIKIMADLATMTGRVRAPGPPPFRATSAMQSVTLSPTEAATQSYVPANVRRGPRTKNTRSKILEAAATSRTSTEPRPIKEDRPESGSCVAKASPRRRTKSCGTTEATTDDANHTRGAVLFKQDPDGKPHHNVLAEVPVPNSGPHPADEDIPMLAAVKNRIRKPKVFYGDSDPPPVALARRGTPAVGSARSKSKAVTQSKKARGAKSESAHRPDETHSVSEGIQSAQLRILPVPKPRIQPSTAIVQSCSGPDESITLAPLRPSDSKPTIARRNPFFQMALGQSEATDPASPPPAFLEPMVSPGPFDQSPQMSPNHWRKRAFSYGNALSKHFETSCRNLDFSNLGIGNAGGGAGVPAYMEYPRRVPTPGQQLALVEAPPLLVGASIAPRLSPLVEPLSAPDSPNRQLQRESEAAAALTQMAAYDHRQFAKI